MPIVTVKRALSDPIARADIKAGILNTTLVHSTLHSEVNNG
jgi:hypothetical protein